MVSFRTYNFFSFTKSVTFIKARGTHYYGNQGMNNYTTVIMTGWRGKQDGRQSRFLMSFELHKTLVVIYELQCRGSLLIMIKHASSHTYVCLKKRITSGSLSLSIQNCPSKDFVNICINCLKNYSFAFGSQPLPDSTLKKCPLLFLASLC